MPMMIPSNLSAPLRGMRLGTITFVIGVLIATPLALLFPIHQTELSATEVWGASELALNRLHRPAMDRVTGEVLPPEKQDKRGEAYVSNPSTGGLGSPEVSRKQKLCSNRRQPTSTTKLTFWRWTKCWLDSSSSTLQVPAPVVRRGRRMRCAPG